MSVVAAISPDISPLVMGQGAPKWHVRLKDSRTGRPFNLTGGTVTGKLGSIALTGTFALESPGTGTFTYSPVAADIPTTAGRFLLQFKVSGTTPSPFIAGVFPVDVQGAVS